MRSASDHDLLITVATEVRGWTRRVEADEADRDALRHEVIKLRSTIETLPCSRHAELMREHTRRISELVKAVQRGETTGQIEVARLEAERKARERFGKEIARKWQVYAAIAAVVSTAAGLGIFRLIAG
jgi:hypothetical protein